MLKVPLFHIIQRPLLKQKLAALYFMTRIHLQCMQWKKWKMNYFRIYNTEWLYPDQWFLPSGSKLSHASNMRQCLFFVHYTSNIGYWICFRFLHSYSFRLKNYFLGHRVISRVSELWVHVQLCSFNVILLSFYDVK